MKTRDEEWNWADKPATERAAAISELLHLDLSREVEEKGGFSYLPWPVAQREMLRRDPNFHWELVDWPNGLPYIATPAGCFVRVAVTFMGHTQPITYPVLDHRNKPIPEPTVFDINTAQMRAFTKACAFFGLALYIYEGENVPPQVDHEEVTAYANRYRETLKADMEEDDRALAIWEIYREHVNDEPLTRAIGDRMTRTQVRQMKEYVAVGGDLAQQQPMRANGRS